MHPVEITFYKVIVLIAAAAAIAFGITNVVYWNRVRLNDNCQEVTSGTATTLIWLNLVMVFLAAVVFLWSFFRLVFTGETKKEIVNKTYNTHTHNYPASPLMADASVPVFSAPVSPLPV